MSVLIPMLLVIVIVIVNVMIFDHLNPPRRTGHLIVVKHIVVEQVFYVDVGVVAFHYLGVWLQASDYLAYALQLFGLHFGHLVEHNHVAELNLLDNQVFYILIVYIVTFEVVAAAEFVFHSQSVDHSHYAVEARGAELGVFIAHARNSGYGACYRLRLANSAGLYDYVVETAHLHDVGELFYEVHLQGAADATVLKSHQTLVFFAHYAAFLNEVGVNVDLSYIVDNHCKTNAFLVGKNVVDQCCLTTSEITGQKQDRSFLSTHISCF